MNESNDNEYSRRANFFKRCDVLNCAEESSYTGSSTNSSKQLMNDPLLVISKKYTGLTSFKRHHSAVSSKDTIYQSTSNFAYI
jgi:hypothetical protein